MKQKFISRVSELENINADFLSMTLETLMGVMINGKVYSDDIVLNKSQYEMVWEKAKKGKSATSIVELIKANRTVEKNIWDELFVPYIDEVEQFKQAVHNFIEDRNHIAHSKVLSWNSYQIVLNDFDKMDNFIRRADSKFDSKEMLGEIRIHGTL